MQFALNAITTASTGLSNLVGSGATPALSSLGGQGTSPTPFGELLTDAVGQVSKLQDQASTAVTGLMTGSGVDVHQAMIAAEKATMSFELALAVRNKAVQAYQQVVGMQF